MHIESAQLFLRDFVSTDAPDLFALDSDPKVMRFISSPATDLDQSITLIEQQIAYYKNYPGLGAWPAFTKSSGDFIGLFALKMLDETSQIEVVYRLKPAFWGMGYATEMSRILVNYGLKELKLPQIVGVTQLANLASQRVLKKVGLHYVQDAFYYGTTVKLFSIP